jgi:hypothetical protein
MAADELRFAFVVGDRLYASKIAVVEVHVVSANA